MKVVRDKDVQTHELIGTTWWFVSRHFRSEGEALAKFDLINREAAKLQGEAQFAGYRLLDDTPKYGGKAQLVVVVGSVENTVRAAARRLGGETWVMHPRLVRSLVARRMRFLIAANEMQVPSGVYRSHFEGGMRLDEAGRPVPND